jgi:hypothetical protein
MIDPLTRLTAIEEIRQLTATPFGIAVRISIDPARRQPDWPCGSHHQRSPRDYRMAQRSLAR